VVLHEEVSHGDVRAKEFWMAGDRLKDVLGRRAPTGSAGVPPDAADSRGQRDDEGVVIISVPVRPSTESAVTPRSFASRRDTGRSLRSARPDTNPDAISGSDLLDIRGKVDYVGINSVKDGTTEIAAASSA
jgi:hypothetical protein